MVTKRKPAADTSPRSTRAPASSSGSTTLDVEALRQIVEILESSDVTRLVWKRGEERLFIRRGQAEPTIVQALPAPSANSVSPAKEPASTAPPTVMHSPPAGAATAPAQAAAAVPPPPPTKPGHTVSSPFVGTFYRTPAPDQPPFVDTGSLVKKGQVLCIIEAMKLMNEIESEVAGRIAEVLVENGQPVEFGQPLFRIEPV